MWIQQSQHTKHFTKYKTYDIINTETNYYVFREKNKKGSILRIDMVNQWI